MFRFYEILLFFAVVLYAVYIIEKITFELEGHEMWLLNISNIGGDTIIHSPNCSKCKNTSTKSSTTESISDYWGW